MICQTIFLTLNMLNPDQRQGGQPASGSQVAEVDQSLIKQKLGGDQEKADRSHQAQIAHTVHFHHLGSEHDAQQRGGRAATPESTKTDHHQRKQTQGDDGSKPAGRWPPLPARCRDPPEQYRDNHRRNLDRHRGQVWQGSHRKGGNGP